MKPSGPSCPPTLLVDVEDRRQRYKEKQVSPIYPWDHMHRAARETEEEPHKLLLFMKHPPGEIIILSEFISLFSYQELQKTKGGSGDYLEDPEKYIRAFKGVTLLYDHTCNVCLGTNCDAH